MLWPPAQSLGSASSMWQQACWLPVSRLAYIPPVIAMHHQKGLGTCLTVAAAHCTRYFLLSFPEPCDGQTTEQRGQESQQRQP